MTIIKGKDINLRDVDLEDAEFILSLRIKNQEKNNFLHAIDNDLSKQVNYIKKCKETDNNWYFIIESKSHQKLGTLRIYDIIGDSFCWGSWLIIDDAPISTAIQSALLTYEYAFYELGFSFAHFDVRKDNKRVQEFHNRMGAKKIGETELDILYNYSIDSYTKAKSKYKRWLPK